MEMIKSFKKTTDLKHTELLILLDKDDSSLGEYLEHLPADIKFQVFDRENDKTLTTEIINRTFKQNNSYEFYSVTNDDIEYETEGWDKVLCNKGKISTGVEINMVKKYGKSVGRIHVEGFPIISVIDGDIIRSLGWLQYPDLRHSCGDNVWYWIARRLKILNIHRDIIYRHRSAYFNDGEEDDTFKRTNAKNNIKDRDIYMNWLKYKINNDLHKIKEKDNVNELSSRCSKINC